MAGFAHIGQLADAASLDGKCWAAQFRKQTTSVTVAGQWFDFSTAAGNPVANFYASAPLLAATLDADKGIPHGPVVTPERKYLHRIMTVQLAASATAATSQNMTQIFMDYLLYYPFIDLDAVGEQQDLTNTVTLPRYADGAGVRMMMVAQGATVGGGTFTVTYTNQAGVAGRVTPLHYCVAAQPYGALVTASGAAGGAHPFLTLQEGDSGVRSVQSLTMSLANGGLGCIVLVKPLQNLYQAEESRRTTASTLESFGSPAEVESLRQRAGITAPIHDAAVLSFIGLTAAGSVASAQIVGLLETVWS